MGEVQCYNHKDAKTVPFLCNLKTISDKNPFQALLGMKPSLSCFLGLLESWDCSSPTMPSVSILLHLSRQISSKHFSAFSQGESIQPCFWAETAHSSQLLISNSQQFRAVETPVLQILITGLDTDMSNPIQLWYQPCSQRSLSTWIIMWFFVFIGGISVTGGAPALLQSTGINKPNKPVGLKVTSLFAECDCWGQEGVGRNTQGQAGKALPKQLGLVTTQLPLTEGKAPPVLVLLSWNFIHVSIQTAAQVLQHCFSPR